MGNGLRRFKPKQPFGRDPGLAMAPYDIDFPGWI
jgi:hypothetical protein